MRDDHMKLMYVLGYLEGTIGSVNDYSVDELKAKMEFLVNYIKDRPVNAAVPETERTVQ